MESLIGKYSVYYNGEPAGTLNVTPAGLRTEFDAVVRPGTSGILRLMCLCEGGYISLGVMLPDNDTFTLRKALTKNALRDMGLTRIDGCVISSGFEAPVPPPVFESDEFAVGPEDDETAFTEPEMVPDVPAAAPIPLDPAEWRLETSPGRLFYDTELAEACKDVVGALSRREDGVTELAIPVFSGEPFPMMPVFCLGRAETIGGSEYIVFSIKNGKL